MDDDEWCKRSYRMDGGSQWGSSFELKKIAYSDMCYLTVCTSGLESDKQIDFGRQDAEFLHFMLGQMLKL